MSWNIRGIDMKQYIEAYGKRIVEYAQENYRACLREPQGILQYPFIVPGSCYANELWDWDCWLTDLALWEIAEPGVIEEYEKGCVLNFLEYADENGRIPIFVTPRKTALTAYGTQERNIHKPCLAQHALFISERSGGADWLKDGFERIERYLAWYDRVCLHESGLYVWLDDFAIGVDNDPCTFYRPAKSSASIYLNCLMFMELKATAKLAELLNLSEKNSYYVERAKKLAEAIQEHCWDERDGFFYNVDTNLLPIDKTQVLHSGCPRHWSTLLQRIEVWACFLPMWAGIATPEQAERMVKEHYRDNRTFNAPYGVRTLSKMEKMYAIIKSGNPSCWLGPIWGISNYLVFEGLHRYGYLDDAKELAEKTITLFGKDLEKCGQMHEYYDPESGEGINNPGFQNWNFLAVKMFSWLKSSERHCEE